MSAYRHRKTLDPLDRLTTEERGDISLARLATQVSTACDKWLRSRGIGPGRLFTYAGPDKPRQHGKDGRIDGTGGEAPRGLGKKVSTFNL